MFIEFEDTIRSAGLIDTRIEINIITLDLTRRAGFPIRDGFRFMNIISQTDYSREFYEVIEEVLIKIRSAIILNDSKTIVRFLNALIQDTRNQIAENIFSLN